jgi:hypothetical protein
MLIASQRLREANTYRADAEKILLVKAAEADSESKFLTGVGIARQRRALIDGLRSTVNDFATSVPGTGSQDVMDLLLLTQYFDTMKEMNANAANNSIFLSHGPQSVGQMRSELKAAIGSKK